MNKWERMFLREAEVSAENSPCLSRKIGAVLVRNNRVIAKGYNAPPEKVEHCYGNVCPRRLMGFDSGQGLEHCPAVHAEANAIINAAREGVITLGSSLYLSCSITPCKTCLGLIINSGIKEIVVVKVVNYDALVKSIMEQANVILRTYKD